jgi:hypothetical protein
MQKEQLTEPLYFEIPRLTLTEEGSENEQDPVFR